MIENSPIKSGWRGDINGHIEQTDSHIEVSEVTLKLDSRTAYALCNLLTSRQIAKVGKVVTEEQGESLETLGAALGRLIDHPSANNDGRKIIE